jgi:alpha-tubulin suppressor-like RCC1 family protein
MFKYISACLAGFGYTKAGQQFLQVIRTGVTMVVSGTSHNLALTKTGTVLAWGANDHGQVGTAAVKITLWQFSTEVASHLCLSIFCEFSREYPS